MNSIEIIEKKRDGKILNEKEINFFINGYVENEIADYQASALLMAICIRGMNEDELYFLTKAMLNSGDIMDLSSIQGSKVDKHSTGGVGDKTSLVLAPMLAAMQLNVAKMSGRGLAYTGGTLDKLEGIKGFQVVMDKETFCKQINDIHLAIIGQSEQLVPADRKLYALRDVCGCVPSIPLIASSIMSKKLAAGTDAILLDVKYGDGAFMQTKEDAVKLAKAMIQIGNRFYKKVKAEITSMDQPLGYAIGNTLELKEAILTLQGNGPNDLVALCIHSAAVLMRMVHPAIQEDEAIVRANKVLNDNSAFQKLVAMVKAQHADINQILDTSKLKASRYITMIKAEQSGYLHGIQTRKLGLQVCELGGGRFKKEDQILHEVGILLHHKCSDAIPIGSVLCEIHSNTKLSLNQIEVIRACFGIKKESCTPKPLIYKTI